MSFHADASLNTIAAFEQTDLLSDSDKADVVYFAQNNWVKSRRIKLQTPQIKTLYLTRGENKRTSVSIDATYVESSLSLCEDSSRRDSHYLWKTHTDYVGMGLGKLVRATKEVIDGTLQYEHAIGKNLAFPLMKWGYVPHALSLNDFENDIAMPASESALLDVFDDSFGYVLKLPVWLKYEPLKAEGFLKKVRGGAS